MGYEWDFSLVLKYSDVLFEGFLGTLRVGIVSLILGGVGGLLLALMRMSRHRLLSWPAIALIESTGLLTRNLNGFIPASLAAPNRPT